MRRGNNHLPTTSIEQSSPELSEEVGSRELERVQSFPQPPTATPMWSLRIRPLSIRPFFTGSVEILTLYMLIPILQLWPDTSVLSSMVKSTLFRIGYLWNSRKIHRAKLTEQ
jgi:hypothetical protein